MMTFSNSNVDVEGARQSSHKFENAPKAILGGFRMVILAILLGAAMLLMASQTGNLTMTRRLEESASVALGNVEISSIPNGTISLTTFPVSPNQFMIQDVVSGKCLSVPGGDFTKPPTINANPQLQLAYQTCDSGSTHQNFFFSISSNTIAKVGLSGTNPVTKKPFYQENYCLDNGLSSRIENGRAQLWNCLNGNGANNQWSYNQASKQLTNNPNSILTSVTATKLCLDDGGNKNVPVFSIQSCTDTTRTSFQKFNILQIDKPNLKPIFRGLGMFVIYPGIANSYSSTSSYCLFNPTWTKSVAGSYIQTFPCTSDNIIKYGYNMVLQYGTNTRTIQAVKLLVSKLPTCLTGLPAAGTVVMNNCDPSMGMYQEWISVSTNQLMLAMSPVDYCLTQNGNGFRLTLQPCVKQGDPLFARQQFGFQAIVTAPSNGV